MQYRAQVEEMEKEKEFTEKEYSEKETILLSQIKSYELKVNQLNVQINKLNVQIQQSQIEVPKPEQPQQPQTEGVDVELYNSLLVEYGKYYFQSVILLSEI